MKLIYFLFQDNLMRQSINPHGRWIGVGMILMPANRSFSFEVFVNNKLELPYVVEKNQQPCRYLVKRTSSSLVELRARGRGRYEGHDFNCIYYFIILITVERIKLNSCCIFCYDCRLGICI